MPCNQAVFIKLIWRDEDNTSGFVVCYFSSCRQVNKQPVKHREQHGHKISVNGEQSSRDYTLSPSYRTRLLHRNE